MLSIMAKVITTLIDWSESCSCHWEVLQTPDLPRELKRLFRKCPLRGRRLVGIAVGDMFSMARSMFDASSAKLLVMLPRVPDHGARSMLLREFEQGRHHLLTQLVLNNEPLLRAALARARDGAW